MLLPGRLRLGLSLLFLLHSSTSVAQVTDEERNKIEAEANLQAEEADKLFAAGQYQAAITLYQAERTSRNALMDLRYEALATRAVGCCCARLGRRDEAIEAFRDAIELDKKRADTGFVGYDYLLIAQVEYARENLDEAIEALKSAIPLLGKEVDADHEAEARLLIARVYNDSFQYAEAKEHLQAAFALSQTLAAPKLMGETQAELGRTAIALGNFAEAAEWLIEAAKTFEPLKLEKELAWVDRVLGDVFAELGLIEQAVDSVERALDYHRDNGESSDVADALCILASLAIRTDPVKAEKLANEALKEATAASDLRLKLDATVHVALALYQQRELPRACETIGGALPLVAELNDDPEHVRVLMLTAMIEQAAGNLDDSRKHEALAKSIEAKSLTDLPEENGRHPE